MSLHAVAPKPDVSIPAARPFLKWAGGKTQLTGAILRCFPERFGCYHEPFLGGGAVFFALGPRKAVLSDVNADLVATYRAVRDDVRGLMSSLDGHQNSEQHFYAVRAQGSDVLTQVEAAARTIYLNKTCFNGLYRVNQKGQFNVPFGRYKNPTLYQRENLERAAEALRGVDVRCESVFDIERRVRKGDLVYLDPPYDPVSPTASFTTYAKGGFGRAEQEALAELYARLVGKGAHVVLSNSDTPFIRKLYRRFRVQQVFARRAINARADRRGPVSEVLVVPR